MIFLIKENVVVIMNLNLTLQQRQQLSQAQIQSLEILSMDSVELNQFLKNEYLENPLMEHTDSSSGSVELEPISSYYESGSDTGSYSAADEDDNRSHDFSAPRQNTLEDYLLSQLNMKLYSEKEWDIFIYMIGCLDDSGFFTMPLEEVAQKNSADLILVRRCLYTLQQLEPYGIFSESLQESLLRQLDALDINTEALTQMVLYHLDDIAAGKISNISRSLHLTTAEVRKNIEVITRLNPRPLSGFSSGINNYIIPDIIFRKENGKWEISLTDSWVENYQLNDYYIKMMETSSDSELISYFRVKLNRVQFILNSIAQRRQTILAIAHIILDIQFDFFERNMPLVPMTMADVANRAGISTSTVSRAVKGKYLQHPTGSNFLKDLFTSAVSSGNSGGVTPDVVKQYIKEFIDTEDKKHPYSDQALVKLLAEKEIKVSRRVIAKYREEMGIRGSYDRKSY